MNSFEVLPMILHMLLLNILLYGEIHFEKNKFAPVLSPVILLNTNIEPTRVGKKVKKFLVKIQVSGIFQQHSK